jgi:hypothetical protein
MDVFMTVPILPVRQGGTGLTSLSALPISTAQQTALDLKADKSQLATPSLQRFSVADGNLTVGQTTFTVSAYTPGTVMVFMNGNKVPTSAYTATSGTTVVLADAALATDVIEILSWLMSGVQNAAPISHQHSTADLTGPALPVALGGTNATSAAGALAALGASASVATIAALRALPYSVFAAGATVTVAARTAIGDGGDGVFVWSAVSTATDDGALVIQPSGLSAPGRWLRAYSGEFDVRWFGANGSAGDGARIQAACDAAVATGVRRVVIPALPGGAAYQIDQTINNAGIRIEGRGNPLLQKVGAGSMFTAGIMPSSAPGGSTLAADVAVNASTLTLTTGAGASFAPGDRCLLLSDAYYNNPPTTARRAEWVTVQSVSGDTITLAGPLRIAYAVADSARLLKPSITKNVAFVGLNIRMDPTVAVPAPSGNPVFLNYGLLLQFCDAPLVEEVWVSDNPAAAIVFYGCTDGRVIGGGARDLGSAQEDTNGTSAIGLGGYGYGVAECAANHGLLVEGFRTERCRHLYTTLDGHPNVFKFGFPIGTTISGCYAKDMKEACFDTHAAGLNVTFIGCVADGGGRTGFQIRCPGSRVLDCMVRNTRASAVWVYGDGGAGAGGTECVIDGVEADSTNWGAPTDQGASYDGSTDWRELGAFRDQGRDTIIRNVRAKRCAGPVIYSNSATLRGFYKGIEAIDPCQSAGVNKYAIMFTQGTDNPRVSDVFIRSNDGKVVDLVRTTSQNCNPYLHNVEGKGYTGARFSCSAGGNQRFLTGGYGQHALSAGQRSSQTITSNAISVSGVIGSRIQLVPSSGTTDTLNTINGGEEGMTIELLINGANTITLTHGTGNILLKGNANVAMNDRNSLRLNFRLGAWFEDGRNF